MAQSRKATSTCWHFHSPVPCWGCANWFESTMFAVNSWPGFLEVWKPSPRMQENDKSSIYFETHHPATNRLTAKSLKFYEENGSSTVDKRLQYIFERREVNGSGSPTKHSWAWMSWNSALEASDLPCRLGGYDWKQSLYGRFVYMKVLHPPALTTTIKQAEKGGGYRLLPNILPEDRRKNTT